MKRTAEIDEVPLKQSVERRPETGMALATLLVIIGLILSKVTGFLRETLISIQFTKELQDAYSIAFRVPELVYQLLVGGAISAAITPTLARSLQLGEEKKGFRAISIFISVAGVAMGLMVVVGIFSADYLYPVIYPNPENMNITLIAAKASKILFPQIFFMMMAAFSIGILNAYKKFAATSMGPTIYNVFVLLSIIIFGGPSEHALYRTMIGIMSAALIYFLFQLTVGHKYLKSYRFSLQLRDSDFRSVFRLAVPILISSSIIQLNTLVITSFANRFSEIQFSIQNAVTLWQLPYGIFAVGVGSVMLPTFAGYYAARKSANCSDLLSSSLRNALFLTIPMTGLLIMMPTDIVRALFSYNQNYPISRVLNTSQLLLGYSAAVIIQTVIFLFNQAYYAIGKTIMPMISGAISLCVIIISNYLLILVNPQPRPIYLALSYCLAGIASAAFLVSSYVRNRELMPRNILRFSIKAAIGLFAMVVVLFFVNKLPYQPEGKLMEFATVFVKGIVGLSVFLIAAWVLRMPELKTAVDRIFGKFKTIRKRA